MQQETIQKATKNVEVDVSHYTHYECTVQQMKPKSTIGPVTLLCLQNTTQEE